MMGASWCKHFDEFWTDDEKKIDDIVLKIGLIGPIHKSKSIVNHTGW